MIKGKKIILDTINPEDIEWMRNQRNDPALRKYFREWKDISKDQQENWYKSRGNNTDPKHIYFAIRLRSTGELVGCTGLLYIDWRLRSAEFSVFVDFEQRGRGLGKETLMMLFDFGFREANLHKIWAEVYDFNKAVDIYTKALGMTVDGKLRHSTFHDGKYYDSIMLSILESEWFEKHEKQYE